MSQVQSMLVKTAFRRKALVNDAHWYMGIEDMGKFEREIFPSILHYHRDDDHTISLVCVVTSYISNVALLPAC